MRLFAGLSALLLLAPILVHAADTPPPIAAYAGLPSAAQMRMSQDGDHLALIAPFHDLPAFVVRDISGSKVTVLPTGETIPDWFQWKTAHRLMASIRFTATNRLDDPIAETRLIFLDDDGKNVTIAHLNRDPAATGGPVTIYGNPGNRVPQFQDRLVSLLPDDPDHVLMAVTPLTDYVHPQVVRVDVNSGRPSVIHHNRANVTNWIADGDGQIRAAVELGRAGWGEKETQESVIIKNRPEDDWVRIDQTESVGGHRLIPAGFTARDPGTFYILTDQDSARLVAHPVDMASHQSGAIVAHSEGCDIEAMQRNLLLVGFRSPCHPDQVHYLDPEWQRDWEVVRHALKTDYVTLIDRSEDGKRTLVRAKSAAAAPDSYWLLDRRQSPVNLSILVGAYSQIQDEQIATPRWVSYAARDGLKIPALVTLPVAPAAGPLPFIILPHGGPTAEDRLQFDWIAQFLASRGYGVLQPQFRGSTGRGLKFQEAGYQQWGRAMQDDVTDGTKWLIDQKMADPGRICIVGGSYGGYAALMGVIREPDLYRCAAAFAPVADLNKFIGDRQRFAFRDFNLPRIKPVDQDIDETSPVENADKIKVPVLLMHGRKDFNVPVEHSERMERALKHAGKRVEAIYLENADHYFAAATDRLAWLTALERFLGENIGKS